MTDNNHSITPPPELVQQWVDNLAPEGMLSFATQAARWGADQELLACSKYLEQCAAWEPEDVTELHNYRRPKPPSLKEQAINTLHLIRDHLPADMYEKSFLIRRALEQLDD